MTRMTSLALLASALMAACTSAPLTQPTSPATTLNGVLVGPNQMTLYVFDRDTIGSGMSACNGECATHWPPLMAPKEAAPIGDWSTVPRDDGSSQWAYKGRPLYYWTKDGKLGDTMGDGLANAWRVARP